MQAPRYVIKKKKGSVDDADANTTATARVAKSPIITTC